MNNGVSDQYVEKLNNKCHELFNTDIKSYLREQTVKKRITDDICKDFGISNGSLIHVYRKLGIVWHKRTVTKKQLANRDLFRKILTISHGNPSVAQERR